MESLGGKNFRLPEGNTKLVFGRADWGRQLLYLIASWLFYVSWGSWLISVLLFSSLMNYALGEWLRKRITAGAEE